MTKGQTLGALIAAGYKKRRREWVASRPWQERLWYGLIQAPVPEDVFDRLFEQTWVEAKREMGMR